MNEYRYPARKIAVAMSGGVDSSVVALMLHEQGYDVAGVTMKLWNSCSKNGHDVSDSAVRDAQRVAEHIGIPHFQIDLSEIFYQAVVEPFCKQYLRGRTPNPCILCNPLIKFGALFEYAADRLGADMIATGHYARIEHGDACRLRKGVDNTKDQAYFLSRLTTAQLAVSLFPLGVFTKQEIVAIARSKQLPVAGRPESQEICFLPDGSYGEFVMESGFGSAAPGPIVDTTGKQLGLHHGLPCYTIGQRRNLGVALGKPQYVIDIIPETNTFVIGDDELLFHSSVCASCLNCLYPEGFPIEKPLHARIRYRHHEAPGHIRFCAEDRLEFIFDQPQRAITPGQQLVIYDGEYIVGSGFIDHRF